MPGVRNAVALAAALLFLGAPSVADAIIGGAPVQITDDRYSAALVDQNGTLLCGGAIRDLHHVITAAHCVDTFDPEAIFVVVGTSDLLASPATRQQIQVRSYVTDPAWRATNVRPDHDAAVLRLVSDIQFDDSRQPIPLATSVPAPGTILRVSGWGSTTNGGATGRYLNAVNIPLVSDADCATHYGDNFSAALMLCAGDTGRDSCQGDSGGPLIQRTPTGDALVGIVAAGDGCGGPPGVYTEVPAASTYAFLKGAGLSVSNAPPQLTGTPKVGQTLTCGTGGWTGTPQLTYEFYSVDGNSTIQYESTLTTYALTAVDVGRTIGCRVRADHNSPAWSNTVGPVAAASSTTKNAGDDTTAPKAVVKRAECTLTRCLVRVTIADKGVTAGVKKVTATYVAKYTGKCVKGGVSVTCTRRRTGKAKTVRLAETEYRVVVNGLPSGAAATIRITAVDNAGNKQKHVTSVTRRTKSR